MTAPPVLPDASREPVATPSSPGRAYRAGEGRGAGPWIGALMILLALSGLVGLALLWNHKPQGQFFFPRCTFQAWTGLQCPGCGGLRATHELLHGNVGDAWRHNPLLVASLPLVAWSGLALMVERRSGRRWPHPLGMRHAWMVVMALIVGFGILRNL